MVLLFVFVCELERQSYFLLHKHPGQIKKEGNVRWMGLTLNHPPTQPAPVTHCPVTIATEKEVGIFKVQAAALGILKEITTLSTPHYCQSETLLV